MATMLVNAEVAVIDVQGQDLEVIVAGDPGQDLGSIIADDEAVPNQGAPIVAEEAGQIEDNLHDHSLQFMKEVGDLQTKIGIELGRKLGTPTTEVATLAKTEETIIIIDHRRGPVTAPIAVTRCPPMDEAGARKALLDEEDEVDRHQAAMTREVLHPFQRLSNKREVSPGSTIHAKTLVKPEFSKFHFVIFIFVSCLLTVVY